MNEKDQPLQVADGMVVTLDYTLTVDGEVVDTSEGKEPIQFIQGEEHIIKGLERELYGMRVGESKSVDVDPENGYGDYKPEAGMEISKEEFPLDFPIEPGVELKLKSQEGETINAHIQSISEDSVRLDFNHPLAGKDLHFDVEVLDLRQATAEELAHGHVH